MTLPRRTIPEILALHDLEVTLFDVYVEGPSDRNLLAWYFAETGFTHAKVYEVDVVELDAEVTGGNRGRLLHLADQLAGRLSSRQLACICDRDFDDWIPSQTSNELIVLTDFACMECYLLDIPTLEKFLRLFVGTTKVSAVEVLRALCPVLHQCFFIRLAHTRLYWPLHWVSAERCCTCVGEKVEFDLPEFLRRLLQNNGHSSDVKQLNAQMDELIGAPLRDFRLAIHGHDLANLLYWYLRNRVAGMVPSAATLVRGLVASVDLNTISAYDLFDTLQKRASRTVAE